MVILKKGGTLSLILIITSIFESYLSLSECWWLFYVFTPYLSIRILCVSFEDINLIESNLPTCDFHKLLIFEQPRHCNTDSCRERKTGCVNVYFYGYVILFAPVGAVCLFVCMASNQTTSKKPCHMLELSKLTPCSIKHTTRSLWY